MFRKLLFCTVLISGFTFAQKKYVLVVHGGAGTISKENLSPEKESEFRQKLTEALNAGYTQLQAGNSSVDAVAAAIVILEDSPLFNAGKGAVFNSDGKNEMDASIMTGHNMKAGAVAGVSTIKNPIKAAIAVMNNTEHVMLSGQGAEKFAASQKLEIVDPQYFFTQDRWDALQRLKKKEAEKIQQKTTGKNTTSKPSFLEVDYKFGTVGAVALDKNGNIAAGTSTGGMTNKKWNRIGDSPIIGAGNYANSQVGISGTGWGEFFIRTTAARTVAAKMEYQNKKIKDAAQDVVDEIKKLGGDGGLIALDKGGNIAMPFNTAGMYRGAVTEDGDIEVAIYKDEAGNSIDSLTFSSRKIRIKAEELKKLKKIDLVLTNLSFEQILYDARFSVEILKDNQWQKVPFKNNVAIPDIQYVINPKQIKEIPFYFNFFAHTLERGKYRISKTFSTGKGESNKRSTEFEIL